VAIILVIVIIVLIYIFVIKGQNNDNKKRSLVDDINRTLPAINAIGRRSRIMGRSADDSEATALLDQLTKGRMHLPSIPK
jgi:syntaxin 1B/2/3